MSFEHETKLSSELMYLGLDLNKAPGHNIEILVYWQLPLRLSIKLQGSLKHCCLQPAAMTNGALPNPERTIAY